MGRCYPWLGVEQVELNLFGLVPRQTHERIVPLPFATRKYPSRHAPWTFIVPRELTRAWDVPDSPANVTHRFNFLRLIASIQRSPTALGCRGQGLSFGVDILAIRVVNSESLQDRI